MYTWHILTIGHLSRNKFWGERNDTAYRAPLATSALLLGEGHVIVTDPSLPAAGMRAALLDAAGLAPEDVTLVFSTHNHLDHHVDPLCFPNARWFMPQVDLTYLHEHWDEHKRSFPGDDWETVQRCEAAPEELAPGLKLLPLPGHTAGTSGLLFCAPEGRVLLTGEISDELFGYKYTDFAPSPAAFQEESAKRIRELHMYDVLRADRCISVNSLEARVPFGDLDFVQYVMSIDPAKKCNVYGKGKYLLRHAFEGDWLPHDILMREKAAFSDAVGHSMVDDLKAYAEETYTDIAFDILRRKYDFAQPFTKESLLYRELFERYYPDQARMVSGFWMPNKAWAGCDVNDPSARVLANYGDSGK